MAQRKTTPKKPVRKRRTEYDQSYKRLFSHPKMVEDLLKGFVHEDWVKELDFTTLEVFKDSFVSDNLLERHDDIIWRVRWGKKKWLYVYLLLEFQSSIDHFMAVRIMVYIGLLYQYLIDSQKMQASDKLPPVLPLVIYNGSKRWDAARDISELIVNIPGDLEKYCPHLHYFLVDEGKYENAELVPLHNLVAAIIRLENTRTLENEKAVAQAINKVLGTLTDWLKDDEFPQLRRDIITWLSRTLLPKNVPNVKVPEFVELQEMKTMLHETMQNWYRDAEIKGEARGITIGEERGITIGEERGEARGETKILTHLLETKFGILPPSERATIERLNSDAMLKCSERLLTAKTLQEVIKPA